MQDKFNRWVKDYATAADCGCTLEASTTRGTLEVGGLSIQLGLDERTGMLFLQTGVGLFPDRLTMEEKVAFFQSLLGANNLFAGTRGFTLGVDSKVELITLQLAWDFAALDEESFNRLVTNFLTAASEWLVRLEDWRPGADERKRPSESEAAWRGSSSFLQV